MTGIDRLRAIAGAWDEWGLGGTLAEMADEIERELSEERDRWDDDLSEAQVSWNAVAGVCLDMERHCLGHEGMEDSPVARWARELREALGGEGHDLADEDREAIAWVRDHGGLSHVKDIYHDFRAVVERLGIEWSESELHGLMDALDRRLMPGGIEWPRYDSGELVQIGDDVENRNGACTVKSVRFYSGGGVTVYGEDRGAQFVVVSEPVMRDPIRKARPKVLASDGEPLEVGQTVWDMNGDELVVGAVENGGHTVTCRYADVGDSIPTHGMWSPSDLTHQRPVLDADGVPIKVGDTVYFTDGREQECNTVVHARYAYKDEPYVQLGRLNEAGYPTYTDCSCIDPSQLTHAKPEPRDSWERLEEDAEGIRRDIAMYLGDYSQSDFEEPGDSVQSRVVDLVRRCRALAERERGE